MAKKVSKASTGNNGVACAVLSYVLIGIIWYFVDEKMKKNSLARFHVKQALVLLIVSIIFNVVGMLPFFGWIVSFVGGLLVLVLWIMGLVYAATGKEKELPVVGQFAEKLAF